MDYMEQKSCSICIFPEKTIIYSLFFFPSKNPMYAFYRFQFYCILLSIRNLVKKNTELSKKKKSYKNTEKSIYFGIITKYQSSTSSSIGNKPSLLQTITFILAKSLILLLLLILFLSLSFSSIHIYILTHTHKHTYKSLYNL